MATKRDFNYEPTQKDRGFIHEDHTLLRYRQSYLRSAIDSDTIDGELYWSMSTLHGKTGAELYTRDSLRSLDVRLPASHHEILPYKEKMELRKSEPNVICHNASDYMSMAHSYNMSAQSVNTVFFIESICRMVYDAKDCDYMMQLCLAYYFVSSGTSCVITDHIRLPDGFREVLSTVEGMAFGSQNTETWDSNTTTTVAKRELWELAGVTKARFYKQSKRISSIVQERVMDNFEEHGLELEPGESQSEGYTDTFNHTALAGMGDGDRY